MTIPTITGYFFERYCKSMPLIVLISLLVNVLLLIVMNVRGRQILAKKEQKAESNQDDKLLELKD